VIGDVVSNVVLSFKGDVKDLKDKLKELSGEERKLMEAQVKQAEARNKHLEQWKTGLTTVGVALGVAGGIAKMMWEDYKSRAEEARLRTAAFGVDIDMLGKAAMGTKSKMELLAGAAKMNHGVFKLTSDQMVMVERAMIELTRRGHEAADVQRKVLQAVTELKLDGLQELGIVIDKTGATMDSADGRFKLFSNTLTGLNDVAKQVATGQRTMAEEAERAAARTSDAWKKFKEDWLTGDQGANYLWDKGYRDAFHKNVRERMGARASSGNMNFEEDMAKAVAELNKNAQRAQANASQYPKFGHELEMEPMNVGALRDAAKSRAKQEADRLRKISDDVAKTLTDELLKELEMSTEDMLGTLDGGAGWDEGYSLKGGEDQSDLTYSSSVQGKRQSLLEKTFGPIQEFDAYRTAFDTLQGATQSAFAAWIDGSAGAGKAFKQFMGESLKGTATFLLGESIKFGLMALASAIPGPFFNPASAAAYGATAAKYAAGAALVGVLAKGLGGGSPGSGGSGSSAPGGGVPSYTGGGGQGGGSNNQVVVIGQDYSNDSARERQLKAARVLELARQAGGTPGVSYA
jgi:hypothetical protein